jgi:hypothetical protein
MIGKTIMKLKERIAEGRIEVVIADRLLEEITEVARRKKFEKYFQDVDVKRFSFHPHLAFCRSRKHANWFKYEWSERTNRSSRRPNSGSLVVSTAKNSASRTGGGFCDKICSFTFRIFSTVYAFRSIRNAREVTSRRRPQEFAKVFDTTPQMGISSPLRSETEEITKQLSH